MGRNSWSVGERCFLRNSARPSETSARAVLLRSAPKCNSAIIAASSRLHTAPAAIAIARSVTAAHVTSGSAIEQGNFCRFRTATSCLRCLMNWRRWRCKTRASFTGFCFEQSPSLCWKWQPIPNGWEPGLVSLRCYTRGRSDSSRTLTQNAWHYHLIDFQGTTRVGFPCDPLVRRACLFDEAARGYFELVRS